MSKSFIEKGIDVFTSIVGEDSKITEKVKEFEKTLEGMSDNRDMQNFMVKFHEKMFGKDHNKELERVNKESYESFEQAQKARLRMQEQYHSLSPEDLDKFKRFNAVTGGIFDKTIVINPDVKYGDIPQSQVKQELLGNIRDFSYVEKLIENSVNLDKPLDEIIKAVDTPRFKELEANYKARNNEYRESTKDCLNDEDIMIAKKVFEDIGHLSKSLSPEDLKNKDMNAEFKKLLESDDVKPLMDKLQIDISQNVKDNNNKGLLNLNSLLDMKLPKLMESCEAPTERATNKNKFY